MISHDLHAWDEAEIVPAGTRSVQVDFKPSSVEIYLGNPKLPTTPAVCVEWAAMAGTWNILLYDGIKDDPITMRLASDGPFYMDLSA